MSSSSMDETDFQAKTRRFLENMERIKREVYEDNVNQTFEEQIIEELDVEERGFEETIHMADVKWQLPKMVTPKREDIPVEVAGPHISEIVSERPVGREVTSSREVSVASGRPIQSLVAPQTMPLHESTLNLIGTQETRAVLTPGSDKLSVVVVENKPATRTAVLGAVRRDDDSLGVVNDVVCDVVVPDTPFQHLECAIPKTRQETRALPLEHELHVEHALHTEGQVPEAVETSVDFVVPDLRRVSSVPRRESKVLPSTLRDLEDEEVERLVATDEHHVAREQKIAVDLSMSFKSLTDQSWVNSSLQYTPSGVTRELTISPTVEVSTFECYLDTVKEPRIFTETKIVEITHLAPAEEITKEIETIHESEIIRSSYEVSQIETLAKVVPKEVFVNLLSETVAEEKVETTTEVTPRVPVESDVLIDLVKPKKSIHSEGLPVVLATITDERVEVPYSVKIPEHYAIELITSVDSTERDFKVDVDISPGEDILETTEVNLETMKETEVLFDLQMTVKQPDLFKEEAVVDVQIPQTSTSQILVELEEEQSGYEIYETTAEVLKESEVPLGLEEVSLTIDRVVTEESTQNVLSTMDIDVKSPEISEIILEMKIPDKSDSDTVVIQTESVIEVVETLLHQREKSPPTISVKVEELPGVSKVLNLLVDQPKEKLAEVVETKELKVPDIQEMSTSTTSSDLQFHVESKVPGHEFRSEVIEDESPIEMVELGFAPRPGQRRVSDVVLELRRTSVTPKPETTASPLSEETIPSETVVESVAVNVDKALECLETSKVNLPNKQAENICYTSLQDQRLVSEHVGDLEKPGLDVLALESKPTDVKISKPKSISEPKVNEGFMSEISQTIEGERKEVNIEIEEVLGAPMQISEIVVEKNINQEAEIILDYRESKVVSELDLDVSDQPDALYSTELIKRIEEPKKEILVEIKTVDVVPTVEHISELFTQTDRQIDEVTLELDIPQVMRSEQEILLSHTSEVNVEVTPHVVEEIMFTTEITKESPKPMHELIVELVKEDIILEKVEETKPTTANVTEEFEVITDLKISSVRKDEDTVLVSTTLEGNFEDITLELVPDRIITVEKVELPTEAEIFVEISEDASELKPERVEGYLQLKRNLSLKPLQQNMRYRLFLLKKHLKKHWFY